MVTKINLAVHLMLIEPKAIRHSGDVVSELTVHEYARI